MVDCQAVEPQESLAAGAERISRYRQLAGYSISSWMGDVCKVEGSVWYALLRSYNTWAVRRTYDTGDIVYVEVLGQPHASPCSSLPITRPTCLTLQVILNSAEAMHHVLEKNSAVSSDRPSMPLFNDL
jgi:hypothetical protein